MPAEQGRAQFVERAAQPWRTVETEHFVFHFPEPLTDWAMPVVARFEPVRNAVAAMVGSVPKQRVTVVMDDPITMANGLAIADLNEPIMLFLATPPDPRSEIGDFRDWGELLSVHEFTHVAHMTRPSRNRTRQLLGRLFTGSGPISTKTPNWVKEGYATYVEGKLTGSGRPHGAWRAAILRQWALEGKLPAYVRLNDTKTFQAGSFAYLAGSAYLEWLVAQRGDSSLVHLWRRLSARENRSFAAAFKGVFGDVPEDLYGRFQVELTARALQAERALKAAGLANGETVQELEWHTGDPALSRDGARMAIVLRSRTAPARVVVWNTVEPPADSVRAAARLQRLLARDPDDVAPVAAEPFPKKPIAVLYPASGDRAYDAPRFFADGKRLLLIRPEANADGSVRPDLFTWNYEDDELRRVTHGAAIVAADPAPDGTFAIAVRCLWGRCDVVRVDLVSGQVATIVEAAPDVAYYRPRISPDGRWFVAAGQRAGLWRTELRSSAGGSPRIVGPDDGVERYDAAFTPDGSAVVLVSEAGGIPNIERVTLASNAVVPLTRVTGAAVAPEVAVDGAVYFLRLHSKGLTLARVVGPANVGMAVPADSTLGPAISPPLAGGVALRPVPVPAARGYGLGNRQFRWLPMLGWGRGGPSAGVNVLNTDPVGRLSLLLQGQVGKAEWSGGSVRAALRRYVPVTVEADVFSVTQDLLQNSAAPFSLPELDATFQGGWLAFSVERNTAGWSAGARAGGSIARLATDLDAHARRRLTHGEAVLQKRATAGGALETSTGLRLHAALGTTDGAQWRRGVATLSFAARRRADPRLGAAVQGTRGIVRGDRVLFEEFLVGGDGTQMFDAAMLSQRRAMPALPAGVLGGRRLTEVKARLTGAALTPYFWAAQTEHVAHWLRVIGVEQELSLPPIPFARLAGTHTIVGIGYALDEKPHRQVRFYASTTFRP